MEVDHLIHNTAMLRNIDIVHELAPALPPVCGDKVQLQQVLINLLLNAFDAMAEAPVGEREVTLRASVQNAGQVQVAV